jgi:cytochrome b561
MTAAPARYNTVAMLLHWLIAAAIIANLVLVLAAPEGRSPERMTMMNVHRALGLTILVLSVVRVAWRLFNPPPPPPPGLDALSRLAGGAMHLALYFLMVAIPLAGWMMVSASHFQVSWFGLFQWPLFPGFGGLDKAAGHEWHETFETIHVTLGWAIIVLIPLHIAAGLYHHMMRKDNVLLRMIPGTRLRDGV